MSFAYTDDDFEQLFRAPKPFDRSTLRPLRDYQAKAIEDIRQAVREGHKRIVLQLPTGGGKTLTSAHIIGSALEKGNRALFTAPAIALVNQTVAAFEAEGIHDIGVIQAAHERTNYQCQTQVASVQTLIRRRNINPDFGVVIIDELHQEFEGLNALLDSHAWRDKVIIGLSATPWSRGLGLRWTKLIIAGTMQSMIDAGYLCPFEVFAPADDVDLKKVRTVAGDFHEGDLAEAMDQAEITADIVETWKKRAGNQPTFLFAVNRAHAASLQGEFRKAGVSCGYIDGFSTPEERDETFRRFRNGDDRIIASVGCLITGVDEDVRVLIDAAPTKSIIRHVQKIGRGLRLAEGKEICTILDHAGNSQRLGLVTDIHRDSLCMKKKGEKEDKQKEIDKIKKPLKCKACGCVMPPGSKVCQSCGGEIIKESNVLVRDGELVQFGSDGVPTTAISEQVFYSGLLSIAKESGYADGWAAHKFKEKFGHWPNGLNKVTMRPAVAVTNWVRSRRIAAAKMRKKAEAHV